MRSQRVLLLCLTDDPFDPPGWERAGGGHFFVFDLGRYLVRLGFDVHYVTRRNSPNKRAFEDLGPRCRIHRVDEGPADDRHPLELHSSFDRLVERVASLLDLADYDVVHSINWLSGSVARRLIRTSGIRHVHSILSLGRLRATLREEASSGDELRDRLELDVFDNADVLIAVTSSERDDLQRLYPEITHDRIVVIPYGVDPDLFYPRPESRDDFVLRQTRRST